MYLVILCCCRYLCRYQACISVEQAVKSVCDYKQAYTQFGGLRPFGVAFLVAGWDRNHGFQIYQTDPSGNYSGWKATVIGQNNQAGKSILKTDYVETNNVEANLKLAVKILMKTMDSTTATPDRMEISVLRKMNDETVELMALQDAEVAAAYTSSINKCLLTMDYVINVQVKTFIDEIQVQQEQETKEWEASSGNI